MKSRKKHLFVFWLFVVLVTKFHNCSVADFCLYLYDDIALRSHTNIVRYVNFGLVIINYLLIMIS